MNAAADCSARGPLAFDPGELTITLIVEFVVPTQVAVDDSASESG